MNLAQLQRFMCKGIQVVIKLIQINNET